MPTFAWTDTKWSRLEPMLPAIRDAGVDVVHTYWIVPATAEATVNAYLDAAYDAGLRVMLTMQSICKWVVYNRDDKTLSTAELATITSFIDKYKDHPALWGVYTDDEGNGQANLPLNHSGFYPISTRQQVYDTIKAAAPDLNVVEAHYTLTGSHYSRAVHDYYFMHAGPTSGMSYVYFYNDVPTYGSVSKTTGLVTSTTNETRALNDFGTILGSFKTTLDAAGETYAVLMQAFGRRDGGSSDWVFAMPPAGGIDKMWAKAQAAGWDEWGVGWFLFDSALADTPSEDLEGFGESGYSAQLAEVTAINETMMDSALTATPEPEGNRLNFPPGVWHIDRRVV